MKKLITSIALILILIVSINARSQSIGLGLEAGVNIANNTFSPKQTTDPDSRTGLIIGGIVDIGFNKNLAIVTGLRYVMKGNKQTDLGITYTTKLDYLEFPA